MRLSKTEAWTVPLRRLQPWSPPLDRDDRDAQLWARCALQSTRRHVPLTRCEPRAMGWQQSDGTTMDAKSTEADPGRDRRLGGRHRPGGPCPGHLAGEAVLRRLDRVRRRAERACLAGRCRDAGHAAGDQRGMRPAGGAHRARPQGQDQSEVGVRPEELFLSRPAAGLSDQPVQVADRGRGRGRGRHARRRDRHGRHRAAASRAGRRQVAARPASDACRSSISTGRAWR